MAETAPAQLQRKVDPARDHTRGGDARDRIELVVYADYLCPYCRRLRHILAGLAGYGRQAIRWRRHPATEAHSFRPQN